MPTGDLPGRRVTMAEIAAAAGVSVATVSKVLNDRADVAAGTRAMVQRTLADHRYEPTARTRNADQARSGRAAAGGLVDMVFNDAGSPWAAEIIRGVESAARGAGASVVVSVLRTGPRDAARWVEDVTARGSLGVILALSNLSDADTSLIARLGVPTVLVDPVGDFESDLPAFGAGNWGGAVSATQHLLDLGHRRIGTITGPMRYLCSQARLAGYRAALERAHIAPDPTLVRQGDFHFDAAVAGATELLALPEPPTAIFAANDEQALGVYAAVQRRGLRVPDDLSVVGFDDVPMSEWVLPPLTTVRQPIRELGELATKALIAAQAGQPVPAKARTELPTTLVVRASTAAPRVR